MILSKNPSPRQLAAMTALAIAVPISIAFYALHDHWWIALIWLGVIFIGCYFMILTVLQVFIYRKIKLIYKLISQTKASKREAFYYQNILPQKTIDEVRQDVEDWGQQRNKEIEHLQRNEKFRKEFLQNLSHEIKTPLFAIQGYVDTLLSGALRDESVNVKFLENTGRNVDRLVTLVEDLDKISKLESGVIVLSKTRFVIQDAIRNVYASLEIKARERNIQCIIKKGCEFPVQVYADKGKIKQALYNMVDNAIKYGRDGGVVEASIYHAEEHKVLIEISDDGAGIAPEQVGRVFERFYRTDDARSRKVGGSGLGLAICKHVIEAHGEQIHVRSKLAVGTTFGFVLPSREGQ